MTGLIVRRWFWSSIVPLETTQQSGDSSSAEKEIHCRVSWRRLYFSGSGGLFLLQLVTCAVQAGSRDRRLMVITTSEFVDTEAVTRKVKGRQLAGEIAELTTLESEELGSDGHTALIHELCKRLDIEATVKPYYQSDGIRIYHDDCARVLPLLESFDLLLTDPPYGIAGKCDGTWNSSRDKRRKSWDQKPPEDWVLQMAIQKSKKAVIWGGNYFNLPPHRGFLVWCKPERNFSAADAEIAWTNIDFAARVCDCHRRDSSASHPTQKPLALMRWCFSHRWAQDVETVIDPYMGSGTTLLAAKLEGRQAVGIDTCEEYCEIAAKRLDQRVLFRAKDVEVRVG